MAARIVNHLQPEQEGSMYGTEAEANAALEAMLKGFKKRPGWLVAATENLDDGDEPWHTVTDDKGQTVGIFYVTTD